MSRTLQCPRWLRRKGALLAGGILLLAVIAVINAIGLRLAGSALTWQAWLTTHSSDFLAWRILLYATTARGWLWMRKRVLAREPDPATRLQLLCAEFAAVAALAVLEVSSLVQHG
ncbi:hypothetical protein [Pseudomonas sp. NBRC 100443]|uniref:hypothetical protein n=1 Tax=Pseudomonas sp. NBRC 100443 TaxID=1113665 RepID=UPI0024A42A97|nr:hypothetical protein [Pseudomonas sp. NBRC 100443]GLU39212.1 hypothetical protein Pssp01_33050 [Pseudomonas sp. NBRC 100443]